MVFFHGGIIAEVIGYYLMYNLTKIIQFLLNMVLCQNNLYLG